MDGLLGEINGHYFSDAARMAYEIEIKNLRHEFNLKGGYDYLGMLKQKALGKNNSWAIVGMLVVLLLINLLFIRRSLVSNIGFDNSGEHCKELKFLQVQLIDKKLKHTHSKVMVDSKILRPIANISDSRDRVNGFIDTSLVCLTEYYSE